MNQTQASRVVFLVGGLMAVYVLVRASRGAGADTFKSLWAVGVLTLGLAVAADFVPQVAGPFAILVGVAMAARNSGELGSVLGGAGRVAGPRTTRPGGSSGAYARSGTGATRGPGPAHTTR